jgi:hypothetical protein
VQQQRGFARTGWQGRARAPRVAVLYLARLCTLFACLACAEDGVPARASDGDGGRKPLRDGAIAFAGVRFHLGTAATTATRDAAAPDAAPADPQDPLRARGEYLVRHVSGCNECHTPRLRSGSLTAIT